MWILGVSADLIHFIKTYQLADHFITVILSKEMSVCHTIVYNPKKLNNNNNNKCPYIKALHTTKCNATIKYFDLKYF